MNTLENLKCRESEVTFHHIDHKRYQIIVWWIIIFQGTLGQHCQYSGSKCSCDRWAISPTHHSFLMCFPWEILRNIEIFAYNLSVTGWVLVLVLLILPFNIWQLSDYYHTWYLSFFLHRQNFWRIKFTPKYANFSRLICKKNATFLRKICRKCQFFALNL